MKNLFLSLVFLVTISSYGQDQKHSIDIENNRCIEQATPTTIGSINCEKQALEAWQAEMETVLQKLQSNPKLLDVALLEASQNELDGATKFERTESIGVDRVSNRMSRLIFLFRILSMALLPELTIGNSTSRFIPTSLVSE